MSHHMLNNVLYDNMPICLLLNYVEYCCQAQGPLTSWLTPRQVYEKSREDPEIGFVMGWPTTIKLFLS